MAPASEACKGFPTKPAPQLEGGAKFGTSSYLKAFSASSVLWEVGHLAKTDKASPEKFDPDQDHYPDATRLLLGLVEGGYLPNGPVERLEVMSQASGEATFRYWTPRADEPEGGYLPAGTV